MRNGLVSGVVRWPCAIDKQASADVGVGVGDDHGDVGGGVEFARVSRGAEAGVAAADGNQVHQEEAFRVGRWALVWAMTTSSARWPTSG